MAHDSVLLKLIITKLFSIKWNLQNIKSKKIEFGKFIGCNTKDYTGLQVGSPYK